MIETLIEADKAITLFFNDIQTPFWDWIMLFFSHKWVWVPLYLAIIASLFFKGTYSQKSITGILKGKIAHWKTALLCLAAILLCFLLTERVCDFIKESVCRLRPGHTPGLAEILNLPEGAGGLYSFPSAHATNTFGLATIVSLIIRRRWLTCTMYAWSTAVAISRIYLSKHFLTDVLTGALLGIAIAIMVFLLLKYTISLINSNIRNKQCSVS